MGFLDFALGVLTGMARAGAKQNSNYESNDSDALKNAKEIQHKRLGAESNYRRCPNCNRLIKKTAYKCKYCGFV